MKNQSVWRQHVTLIVKSTEAFAENNENSAWYLSSKKYRTDNVYGKIQSATPRKHDIGVVQNETLNNVESIDVYPVTVKLKQNNIFISITYTSITNFLVSFISCKHAVASFLPTMLRSLTTARNRELAYLNNWNIPPCFYVSCWMMSADKRRKTLISLFSLPHLSSAFSIW